MVDVCRASDTAYPNPKPSASMKTKPCFLHSGVTSRGKRPLPQLQPGFALIVTVSLMVLLAILAVGLLTLSTVALRSSGQGESMATARANARLALMLAIGELQKNAGPDQRITAPANLVKDTHPQGITGVWKSWKAPASGASGSAYDDAKTGDNFLGYLMANPNLQTSPDPQNLPTAATLGTTQLVSTGSLGSTVAGREISAPLLGIRKDTSTTGKPQGAMSWVVLDEGVKGRIDLQPADSPAGIAEAITQVGAPARNRFRNLAGLEFLNESPTLLQETLPKLVSMEEAKLKASPKDAIAQYFHDFTVSSSIVQADVANGGLKTDLSVLFDGNYGSSSTSFPYAGRYLYSDVSSPFEGATSDALWEMYANYARLYRRTTSRDNPRDGLKATLPATSRYVKRISDSTLRKNRYEPDMSRVKKPVIMPTVARVDTVFSLVTREAHANHQSGTPYRYMLHMMYLPVITLHNPYNVPLRFTNLQVEFSDIPIGFEFLINNQSLSSSGLIPLNRMYIYDESANKKKVFNMTLSSSLDRAAEVVMKPGETTIFGTPFPKNWTWQNELSGNQKMFDWRNNLTGSARTIPGMLTGPNDAAGFGIDWLSPSGTRSPAQIARKNHGVVLVNPTDNIQVRYGPLIPTSSNREFTITVKLNNATAATTQIFYADQAKLQQVLEEGTSPRFPEQRSFPAIFPDAQSAPINTMSIYETAGTRVSAYTKARPFAIFSVGAKTTVESFTKSRPVTDTGIAFQMATCEFINSSSQGTNPLEFAFVPVKNGSAAIESGGPDGEQGFLFGGHGSLNGSTSATIYEIPMAPLQSIAQLRHANGGSLGSVPYVTYTVGESRAHPAIPPEAAFSKPDASRTMLDHSWLANDRLWDGYWFSTLSTLQGPGYTGASTMTQQELAEKFFDGTEDLPNSRNEAYLPAGKTPADAASAVLTPEGRLSAAHILTAGGFNVNSTSVPAWVSVLSGLAEADIPLATGSSEQAADAPFLRIRRPAAAGSTFTPKEKLWNSFRTLTPAEIQKLAEEIVAEVRTRGPFLSMSEFVNRRLGPADELSNKGAIQAALDRTGASSLMEMNAIPISPADVAGYGWQNDNAIATNTGVGAPGDITQGDVLSTIGSFISVRSDTFRIRAYGEARDASGTTVTARACCEAIIQRVPEYVDATDRAEVAPTSPANVQFGRQFRMVSFRWLHPNEI